MPTDTLFTRERVEALTRKHIARYERMKAAAGPGINVEECDHYLRVWLGIQAHGYDWNNLAPFQRAELMEAYDDEEG